MNWLYYLAEANLYLAVFYLAYCLFLTRDTHYQLSRAYLVFSCIVAFVLPVMQAGALRPVKAEQAAPVVTYIIPTAVKTIGAAPAPVISTSIPEVSVPLTALPENARYFTLQDGLLCAYLAGVAILLVMLMLKLYTLFRLARRVQSTSEGKYRVVHLPGTDVAFSFFNYLFIGADAPGANTIITHELVHIRQKHSADIIFLELMKVINWFNPFVYLLQNSLKTVHEYIADEQTAARETDVMAYASFLVTNAYGVGGSSITHSFFNYSLLKKRIIMLNQQRSGNLARLKYLVALPIFAALLCVSTLVFSKNYGWVDVAPAKAKSITKYASPNHYSQNLKTIETGAASGRLTIDPQNKKIVYTAGNLSDAQKPAPVNTPIPQIEKGGDSARVTTMDGKPMLPVVNVDGYYPMDHFLHHNIRYTSAKGERGGLVEVGFTLDNNFHISDAKIVKSGGAKLDGLALNGFNAYKGTVNDAPGKNYVIGVYFFTDDYSIFKTDSMQKVPDFAGELIITNYKYPATLTGKGYEYDESGNSFPGAKPQSNVIIYDENGEGTWYFQNKCTPDDLKMLKDKYGYAFPSASTEAIQFFYPNDIKHNHLAYIYDVNSYLDAAYSGHLYNHVISTIAYPEQAKKALRSGVVMLNFSLDKDSLIKDVTVSKSGGGDFDQAAINSLKSYKTVIDDKPGKHSIAIVFCVAEKKYRPTVSNAVKKDGYVGELAVADLKSPFVVEDK